MKGHVYVEDRATQTRFWTEELYWDFKKGELHSNRHTTVKEPSREIEGDRFTAKLSGQRPTQYHIWQSKGFMPKPAAKNQNDTSGNTAESSADSLATDEKAEKAGANRQSRK